MIREFFKAIYDYPWAFIGCSIVLLLIVAWFFKTINAIVFYFRQSKIEMKKYGRSNN